MNEDRDLLVVRGLKKYFPIRRGILKRVKGYVKAVDGISLAVGRGRTLGLVGESGCGKTTAARTVLRLLEPTAGEIYFDGQPVHQMGGRRLRALRQRLQIIFQDPYSSLNPRMTVQGIVGEPLRVHTRVTRDFIRRRVGDLLERVGLSRAYAAHYPHEFSGGQRQRVGIARALALNPDFIVCDEPVSALDVSVQAQIINLLSDIQRERGISYLFIAHDLSVVEHISHEVAVMYMGRILERAPRAELYGNPTHPYTRLLLAAVPSARPRRAPPEGRSPGPGTQPARGAQGCPFHPRCEMAEAKCRDAMPELREVSPGHWVRCRRV